jgi:hypothetical protein
MPAATAAPTGTRSLQGIEVPAESVNPGAFFALTRRRRTTEYSRPFAGLGNSDTIEFRKSDILSAIHVRFSGTLTVTHSAGAVVPTFRWPLDLPKAFRFTANGQSNLINVSGAKLKVREIMTRGEFDDRGVVQNIGGVAVNQGTLSKASEKWGLAPGQSQATSTSFAVELYWYVPISSDEKDLSGAIFAQTSSMDLTLTIDWESAANLFTTSGGDTVALTGNVIAETEKYSIPVANGQFVVPDLSLFHSMVQTRVASQMAQGDNEMRLVGQGAGKVLLRAYYQLWNGAGTPVPLAMTATNFGPQGWRYASNETPELFPDGTSLRQWNEGLYNSDVGSVFGFGVHEFESRNAFRDVVDMGQASELRLYVNVATPLTNPALEYVQETVFSAGAAA